MPPSQGRHFFSVNVLEVLVGVVLMSVILIGD